jgi:hypothetical protein
MQAGDDDVSPSVTYQTENGNFATGTFRISAAAMGNRSGNFSIEPQFVERKS